MKEFNDGFTDKIQIYMDEFGTLIDEIDEGLSSVAENENAIVKYISSSRCALTLGMALRRFLATKYGQKQENGGYCFSLHNGETINVTDYLREDYDIHIDDVKEYTEVFYDTYLKYNPDLQIPKFTKAEARRLLKNDSDCRRKKMFEISFALHITPDSMNKFLTDVLAEQTYNLRSPEEIIAFFCHSNEKYNSYAEYVRLVKKYYSEVYSEEVTQSKKTNYTIYAKEVVSSKVSSEDELFVFLKENQGDFFGYSQTAYKEFRQMYDKICKKFKVQALSNDSHIRFERFENEQQRIEFENKLNQSQELRSIGNSKVIAEKLGVEQIGNPEQLARKMIDFIPRDSFKRTQNGKEVVVEDFVTISNNDNGRRMRTTIMPKDITAKLLMRDRLDDLLFQSEPVERKDLVFMKYFLFSLYLQEKDKYTLADYLLFKQECDDMLLRCGMSRMYIANRFENLIFLSLLSSNPFEMFSDIIWYSFLSENEYIEE